MHDQNLLPRLDIDARSMRLLLDDLLGPDVVQLVDDDLIGAIAYGVALVQQAPVDKRMEIMGMDRRTFARPNFGITDWDEVVVYVERSR